MVEPPTTNVIQPQASQQSLKICGSTILKMIKLTLITEIWVIQIFYHTVQPSVSDAVNVKLVS
jgi:hypothetical protein